MKTLDVFIDESGNLGHGRGRFFTIGAVVCEHDEAKRLSRTVKSAAKLIKNRHVNKAWKNGEVKAAGISKEERNEVLAKICKRDIDFFDITVDKHNIQEKMFDHKTASYNYWLKLVVDHLIKRFESIDKVFFHIDRRTVRVGDLNAFLEYITIHLLYECNLVNLQIEVDYPESHTNYGIQAADFFANAVNLYHLSGYLGGVDIIRRKIISEEHFPYSMFGR